MNIRARGGDNPYLCAAIFVASLAGSLLHSHPVHDHSARWGPYCQLCGVFLASGLHSFNSGSASVQPRSLPTMTASELQYIQAEATFPISQTLSDKHWTNSHMSISPWELHLTMALRHIGLESPRRRPADSTTLQVFNLLNPTSFTSLIAPKPKESPQPYASHAQPAVQSSCLPKRF